MEWQKEERQQEIEAFPRNMREVGIPEWRSCTEEGGSRGG